MKPPTLDEAGSAIPMPSRPASPSGVDFAWRKVDCWQATIGEAPEPTRWLSFSVELLNDGERGVIGLRARYRIAVTECMHDAIDDRLVVSFGTTEFAPCDTWAEVQKRCGDFAAEWLKVNRAAAVEVDSGKAIGVEGGPDVGRDG